MSQAEDLLTLQEVDVVLDRLNRRLSEIKAAIHETDELITARAALRTADESATRQRAHRKDLELSDGSLETRIKQAEQRLYSGVVKNPKELLDLQNDIASLKRQKNTLDDQLFAAMVALEEAETELTTRTRALTRIEADWRASQGDLITEREQVEQELARKVGEQAEARAPLPAANLTLYDQLRRRKGGLAVVEIIGSLCDGCKVRVPAHVMQQLGQPSGVARCPNCDRILVRV